MHAWLNSPKQQYTTASLRPVWPERLSCWSYTVSQGPLPMVLDVLASERLTTGIGILSVLHIQQRVCRTLPSFSALLEHWHCVPVCKEKIPKMTRQSAKTIKYCPDWKPNIFTLSPLLGWPKSQTTSVNDLEIHFISRTVGNDVKLSTSLESYKQNWRGQSCSLVVNEWMNEYIVVSSNIPVTLRSKYYWRLLNSALEHNFKDFTGQAAPNGSRGRPISVHKMVTNRQA